jgi:hypothetical protein
MSIDEFINEINRVENIDLLKIINKFENRLLKCFRLYKEQSGYEDYKMNDLDFLILYSIWKSKDNDMYNIMDYLVIMYSYYKLEEFYFPTDMFEITKQIWNLDELIKVINIIKNFIYL